MSSAVDIVTRHEKVSLQWGLWLRQIRAILRLELQKNFLSRRSILIYLIALLPLFPLMILALFQPPGNEWQDFNNYGKIYAVLYHSFILRTVIVNLYRVQEARDHYLCPWVFSDDGLRALGLPDMEGFLGGALAWKAFELLRHQYAGHATGKGATASSPGRLLPARVLGRAIRDARLHDLPAFRRRIRMELAPALEGLRDEIGRRYPDLRRFIQQYAAEERSGRPG